MGSHVYLTRKPDRLVKGEDATLRCGRRAAFAFFKSPNRRRRITSRTQMPHTQLITDLDNRRRAFCPAPLRAHPWRCGQGGTASDIKYLAPFWRTTN
ncbi:hypothetical protein SAMN04488512_10415 [Sulfitobacter litoralis]|uniref:Uncharacterized protein n=1 Tax=Sulfitobacter litoralis TaxID=335975 RepID=A0ABY0RX81_9RHOB|nr:hypothetical protein SAMN04488512_10415 [Sulfitobacter litoralis]